MRLKLISCEVFYREMCTAVARSTNQVDIEFPPKGLHDIGCVGMLERVQATLDKVDEREYEAVLFGYGLCNNGLAGLKARSIPIVLPRAHDCITLFLGSKERYLEYFNNNPGVYFKTTGWIERGEVSGELSQITIKHKSGMDYTYTELVEKYGEDNAKYLYDELYDDKRNYSQFTFIEMGIEPDDSFERKTREEAAILVDDREFEFAPREGLGVAVDLGTTTLVAQLLDLASARVLGVRTALNSQARYGADIMSRVGFAVAEGGQGRLEGSIRKQIGNWSISAPTVRSWSAIANGCCVPPPLRVRPSRAPGYRWA